MLLDKKKGIEIGKEIRRRGVIADTFDDGKGGYCTIGLAYYESTGLSPRHAYHSLATTIVNKAYPNYNNLDYYKYDTNRRELFAALNIIPYVNDRMFLFRSIRMSRYWMKHIVPLLPDSREESSCGEVIKVDFKKKSASRLLAAAIIIILFV